MIETSQLLITFLINSMWQIPLVAAIAALCARLVRHAPSAYRHFVWVAALGLCLGLPLASLRSSTDAAGNLSLLASQAGPNDRARLGSQNTPASYRFSLLRRNHIRAVTFAPLAIAFLVCSYIGVFLYRAARIGWSLRNTIRFRDAGYPRALGNQMSAIANHCADAFVLRNVTILCSPAALVPVTLSFPRPTLILPPRFFTEVSEADFSSVLCHELAHIKRHDFLLNLLYEIVSIPVFFHPAAAVIKNRIAMTRELACDEAAAGILSSRTGYARSLLNMAQTLSSVAPPSKPTWALGLFDTDALEERIMNILGKTKRVSKKWGFVLAMVASSLLIVTCSGISAFSFQVTQPSRSATEMQPFVGTWTAIHEGTAYMVLELHLEKGRLVGGIRVCSFNMRMEGTHQVINIVDKTLTESFPIRNLGVSGKSLSFDWKDPDGDEDHLAFEVVGTDAGRLNWVGLPNGLELPSISVTREAAKTH
jgi:beta-lactamase regulating signal transducer with metallopeptidase domain